MNVNNFFNFIGEKRPQYRMSSDNEELLNTLKQGFENGVKTGTLGEREEFLPIPVPEKGFIDNNGKQGLFIQTVGHTRTTMTEDYKFDYQTIYSNYKDNKLDGLQTIMDRFNPDKVQLTIEYSNGEKNGKATRYKGGHVDEVTIYENDHKKSTQVFYKNGQLQQVFYYKQESYGRYEKDVPDTDKGREFYDPNGKPMDKKSFFDNQFNMM